MSEEEVEKIIEMTINKSNKEYISLKEEFEELREDYIELARSDEQLENNWNELKKWLEEYMENTKIQYQSSHPTRQYSLEIIKDVLKVTIDKMQELEDNNE